MPDSEQQLKLYRLLVENSLGLMCIHDMAGVLLAINPAVAESLGYRIEDGLGHNQGISGSIGAAPVRRLPGTHPH
jgi:PAS domain S-box-containing protein